jgi:lysophospholipase L1-like esterase
MFCNSLTLSLSEHTIDAFLVDGEGVRQPYSDYIDFAIGDYYIAFGDSITRGSNDRVLYDNTSDDGRTTGGGYPPVLDNLLTNDLGYPQCIANKGISGDQSIDGLNRIDDIIAAYPEAQYVLIQFGTNDAWAPVPSGLGLYPENDGYAGSFKDNMQRIITAIQNANKIPYLAKVPVALGSLSYLNTSLQEYNDVIDELKKDNNIAITPPDFYCFFENNQDQMDDDLHPDGIGYQSMASLWRDTLLNQYQECVP